MNLISKNFILSNGSNFTDMYIHCCCLVLLEAMKNQDADGMYFMLAFSSAVN